MVKIKPLDDASTASIFKEPTPEDLAMTKLELLKYASNVQSRLKDDITADFTLSKLVDKDKEGTIELTTDAYFFRRLYKILEQKSMKWTYSNDTWTHVPLSITEQRLIKTYSDACFDAFMTRVIMVNIMNRNVDKNYLLKMLASYQEDDQEVLDGTQEQKVSFLEKAKKLFKKESSKKEEE